ncbi:DUF5058 family protein [Anaerobacillus alkaliphilus]|uniref:DUF5058 family protein n=1 Tax=Anaerobacillus alkaliphilus TaxID=1548597 RepID=A0A4Q0VNS3_9BACI|nr:DUF5058 family protein [Anaerobacillus alkaliphilus]RXI97818.1 DUF5058 family protein [Anaerobacillus alkaliphilus]
MQQVMEIANSNVIWLFASLVITMVFIQGVIFIKLATNAGKSLGMTNSEVSSALKTGAISSIGPSLGIMVVAISLITFLGDPLTLMRIGIIGSAPIEALGASLGANAYGVDLGAENFSPQALTTVVWVLCLGGAGGLFVVATFTKSMGKMEKKIIAKKGDGKIMIVVTTAAMIGAFSFLASGEMIKGSIHTMVGFASGITMMGIVLISNKFQIRWLKEWSLGLAIVSGLFFGYIII